MYLMNYITVPMERYETMIALEKRVEYLTEYLTHTSIPKREDIYNILGNELLASAERSRRERLD